MATASDADVDAILGMDTIAVVGCSTTPGKAAHGVPNYMRDHGYTVLPVNPYADEVFGVEAYDSVGDVEEEVDVVNVFRPTEEVAGIVDETLERGDVDAVWLQQGIRDDEAAERARDAGLQVVQDRCMKVEHGRRR
jgi:predicted CoA-binding protein